MADKGDSLVKTVTTELVNIPDNQQIRTIDASVDMTERGSKLINDKSQVYTIAQLRGALATRDEAALFSSVAEPIVDDGAYTFDLDLSRRFVITITEATALTVPTLSVNTATVFSVDVTGDFALTTPNSTVAPVSATYDETISNRLTFDCYRKANGNQVNIVTIENIG